MWESVGWENCIYKQKWESVGGENCIYQQKCESVGGGTVYINKSGKV